MEIAAPGPALETLFSQSMSGRFAMLRQIVSELLSPPGDETEITLHACSILGQSLFYLRSRQMIPRILPGLKLDTSGLEKLARHITEFSLAAIEMRNRRGARPDGPDGKNHE